MPQMRSSGLTLAMTLTLNFQGQIWNLLYLGQRWSDCHKTKANILIELYASNGTIGFDFGNYIDLAFSRSNMEFDISQLKIVWLPQSEKQTYQLNSRPQMWPWPWKVRCKDLTDSDPGDFRCWCAIDSSIFSLAVRKQYSTNSFKWLQFFQRTFKDIG